MTNTDDLKKQLKDHFDRFVRPPSALAGEALTRIHDLEAQLAEAEARGQAGGLARAAEVARTMKEGLDGIYCCTRYDSNGAYKQPHKAQQYLGDCEAAISALKEKT